MSHNHEFFMQKALLLAEEALHSREFPVGCVLEYDGEVVATGRRMNSKGRENELDHGEIVALRNLYSSGLRIDMKRVTVYSTMEPCLMCFSTLIVNGVRKVVYGYEDPMGGGTNLPLTKLSPLYSELDINIVRNILRKESLALFKTFFSDPKNSYLDNSLLQQYTLAQTL